MLWLNLFVRVQTFQRRAKARCHPAHCPIGNCIFYKPVQSNRWVKKGVLHLVLVVEQRRRELETKQKYIGTEPSQTSMRESVLRTPKTQMFLLNLPLPLNTEYYKVHLWEDHSKHSDSGNHDKRESAVIFFSLANVETNSDENIVCIGKFRSIPIGNHIHIHVFWAQRLKYVLQKS